MDEYNLSVEIWFEDDAWHYSVVQEIEEEGTSLWEPLGHGAVLDRDDAARAVTEIIRQHFNV